MAFALPIVERIARDPYGIWAVVLTPTRWVSTMRLLEWMLMWPKRAGIPAYRAISRRRPSARIDDRHDCRRDGHASTSKSTGAKAAHHRSHAWEAL